MGGGVRGRGLSGQRHRRGGLREDRPQMEQAGAGMGRRDMDPRAGERPLLSSPRLPRCSGQVSITLPSTRPQLEASQMRPPHSSLTHLTQSQWLQLVRFDKSLSLLRPIVGGLVVNQATSSQRKHSGVLTEPSGGLSAQPSHAQPPADRFQHVPPASTFFIHILLG